MSLASGDLTTLAAAKTYMDSPPSDTVLSGLISRISRTVQTTLNRSLLIPRTYVHQFDGTGTRQLVLPNYPVLSLSSLFVSGVSVPISPQPSDSSSPSVPYGYRFQTWDGLPPGDPAVVELLGTYFLRGHQNVVATYVAGYGVVGETIVVPNSAPTEVAPLMPFGSWATDQGVTYSTGTKAALTAISAMTNGVPSVPTQGQYVPPDPTASRPNYQFSNQDNGQTLLLSYGYVPADVEQVVLELVSERSAYRKRIGIRSQSLAGQTTTTYDLSGMSDFIKASLRPYINVLPPAMGAAL